MNNCIESKYLLQMYVAILEEIKNPDSTVEYIGVNTDNEPDTITCSFYSSIEGSNSQYRRHDIVFSTKGFYYYSLSFNKPKIINEFTVAVDKVSKNTPNLDEKVGLILLYGAKEYPIDVTYTGILEDMEDYADTEYSSLYRNISDIKPKDIKQIIAKEGIQLDNLFNGVRSTTCSITLMVTEDNSISVAIINTPANDGKVCNKLSPGLVRRFLMGYIKLKYLSFPNETSSFDCFYYRNNNMLGLAHIKSTI